jgi:aldehyde:ferredoxin oxidoreductase
MTQFTKGYAGNILRVNLSTGKVTTEPLPEDLVNNFVGGRGIAAKILYDEMEPGTDPLSPSNKMIFTAGPLAGTPAQSCSRWIVTTKSPQTGGMFRSCAGGGIGLELKYAGFDLLILDGKAAKPSYLFIKDDQVEIREANHLWGLLTRETTENIRKELGDEKVKVAAIGPSGEKLVLFAAIVDERRTASRGGVGAVMGSKNIKAIAVRGSKRIEVADPDIMKGITKKHVETVKNEPKFQGFCHLGTAAAVGFCHELGIYPVKNFQEGVLENVEGRLTGEKVAEIFVKDDHCQLCHIRCGTVLKVKEGPYATDPIEGPEYETLYSFGGEICNTDLGMVIEANRICDDYGVDTMSAGCTVGFAMELYEKGIFTKEDLDGLDLTWGNHEAAIELLKKIVMRNGVGDLLAEGTRKAARKIGKDSEQYAIQVKGLELPGYEPRGLKGSGLNLATAPLGASHCIGQCPQEIMGAEAVDRFSPEGKGELCKFNQDKVAAYETGIVCIFPMALGLVDLPTLGEMLSAATGIEDFKNEDYLFTVGARILNVERAFNVREGFGRKDDSLPPRFLTEPLKTGPAQGHTFELDEMLNQYYEARGWDKSTGYPTRSTLESLGLASVADELGKMDKLP